MSEFPGELAGDAILIVFGPSLVAKSASKVAAVAGFARGAAVGEQLAEGSAVAERAAGSLEAGTAEGLTGEAAPIAEGIAPNKQLPGPGPGPKALPAPTAGGGFNPANFVGKQAVVSPNLKAGTYTALVVDGKVYVARMHITAWELAGKQGVEQFYGFAEIDAAGNVVRLFK